MQGQPAAGSLTKRMALQTKPLGVKGGMLSADMSNGNVIVPPGSAWEKLAMMIIRSESGRCRPESVPCTGAGDLFRPSVQLPRGQERIFACDIIGTVPVQSSAPLEIAPRVRAAPALIQALRLVTLVTRRFITWMTINQIEKCRPSSTAS